jgi:hypothetical protein
VRSWGGLCGVGNPGFGPFPAAVAPTITTSLVAYQKMPSMAQEKQITSILRKVNEFKPQIVPSKTMKAWYGRLSNRTIHELRIQWENYIDWDPPPLCYWVTSKGYILFRRDQAKASMLNFMREKD